jgi:hypothetical protein
LGIHIHFGVASLKLLQYIYNVCVACVQYIVVCIQHILNCISFNISATCIQYVFNILNNNFQYIFNMSAICIQHIEHWPETCSMQCSTYMQYVFSTCSIYNQYACNMRATRLHDYVEHILKVYWTYLPASFIQYMFNTWGLTSILCWRYIEAVGRILKYIEHLFNSLFNILNNLLCVGSICLQYEFNMRSILYWTSVET